ncbi:MAG: dihydrofolate reductase [Patescibacteria group bacterium]|nr:dihydrofolate reductase [Patescibacteria group bacterium]
MSRCSQHRKRQPCPECRKLRNQKIGPDRKDVTVAAVVAIGKNRELGKGGKLLWHIPDDLKRFKAITKGHPVIMGRKTFESILGYLGKPLPERTNIVVTREPSTARRRLAVPGVVVVGSLEEALEKGRALDAEEVHIGGGAQIYEQALPHIDKLYLTLVDDAPEADTFFPPYEKEFTKKVFEEEREWNGIKYRWVDLER